MTTPVRYDIDLWPGCPAEDQKRSGRCWIYASLAPLRRRMCERFGFADFRFSTNYIYYYDQLQKSEAFLDAMIALREAPINDPRLTALLREPISSVGQWSYFAALADEHGVVPLDVMPDTPATEDGTALTLRLGALLREGAYRIRTEEDTEKARAVTMEAIRRTLDESLGKPPEFFFRRGATITPREFLRSVCDYDPHDFILLMHHPSDRWPAPGAYHETEAPERRDPLLTMLSVDMETMMALVLRQLREGEPVVIGADVRHAARRPKGLLDTARLGEPRLSKVDAIAYKEISACHVLCIDGAATEDNGHPTWWRALDSHGSETGLTGHYDMSDAWFEAYVLNAAVKKAYLSSALRALLDSPVYMPKSERF